MLKKCLNCGKEFETTHKKTKCCSRKCSNELLHPKIVVRCDTCGKEIPKSKSEIERSKKHYCSNKCRAVGVGKYQHGENNPNYKGANSIVKCSNCKCEIKILTCNLKNSDGSLKQNFYCSQNCKAEHQAELLKGENNPKWRGGKVQYECDNCGKEISVSKYRFTSKQKRFYCSIKCKSKHQERTMLMENNTNYIDDLSNEHREKHRLIEGYNSWRREVYERDNYTCCICKDSKGGNLNAHHLNGYNWDIENRTNADNGVTLCKKCHDDFHNNFGRGNNTKKTI